MSDSAKSFVGMLPQFGVLAVVLAIAASVFTGKPATGPDKQAAATAKMDADAKADIDGKDDPRATPRSNPFITRLIEFGALDGSTKEPKARAGVDFLILTLPDPVDTQFGARFDELIDATTRAMADVSEKENGTFVVDQFWYPWQSAGKKVAIGESRLHQIHPGMIVFRGSQNSSRRKVVLLVGENPLNGIHPQAMRAALRVAALGPGPEIRIVGPSFTGTQPSLNKAIREWRPDAGPAANWPIQVVSGMALGLKRSRELSEPEKMGLGEVRYSTTRIPSSVMQSAILHYLANPGDTKPDDKLVEQPLPERIAFLIEANTGYGSASATSLKEGHFPPWMLRFPMHISRLAGIQTQATREREEQLGLVPPGASQLKKLDEARRGEDLLPPADEQRTALINKRLLQDYWETLRRERVKYVGVIASDVRDKVFLIAQLRNECPNAVVFVYGSDLQLAHPEYLPSTRGSLVVSTYPLYPAAQQWAKRTGSDTRRVPFASDAGQGTYNAMLIQCGAEDKLLDYRAPLVAAEQSQRPATWISTVAEDGSLMPLAYFINEPLAAEKVDDPAGIMHAAQPRSGSVGTFSPPQTSPLRFLIYAVLIAAGFGGSWILRSFLARPAGVNRSIIRRLKYQYAAILGYGILFAALPLTIYFIRLWQQPSSASYLISRTYPFDGFLFGAVLVAGVLFLLVGVAAFVVQLIWSLGRNDPFENAARRIQSAWYRLRRRPVATTVARRCAAPRWSRLPVGMRVTFALPKLIHLLVSFFALGVLGLLVWDALVSDDSRTALLFLERSANLSAGCSPVFVGILIAAGLFGYGAASLRLIAQQTEPAVGLPLPFRCDEPDSPTHVFSDILNRVRRQARKVHRGGLSLWPLLWERRITALTVFAIAVLILVVPSMTRAHPTWEGAAWTWAFAAGILALFVLTFVSTFRLYAMWMELERLLRLVARVPMVCAFDRLPDHVRRVFRRHLFGYHRRGFDVLIPHQVLAQMEAELRRVPSPDRYRLAELREVVRDRLDAFQLAPVAVSVEPAAPTTEAAATPAVALAGNGNTRAARAEWELAGETAGEGAGVPASQFSATSRAVVNELLPRWVGRPLPEAFGARVDPGEKDEAPTGWQALAEQFVAIQMVVFLGQFFRRLRTMALLAILPAAALLMAVTSYPFVPERLIMFSAVGVVAAVLAVVLWVLYRINKNGVVSRVLLTTPDKFTLDASFLYNLAVYIVPLVTLVVVQVGGRWRTVVEPVLDLIR